MMEINKLDDELYISKNGLPRIGDYQEIWNRIKSHPEVLNAAIKKTKDKFGEKDTVVGLAICEAILIDYSHIEKSIYQELVNLIYSNKQIARIVISGASNGGSSYLLMTLWNHNLTLSPEQKAFAVNEAMNKIGTSRYYKSISQNEKELQEKGITDDITTIIDIDGSKNPIGAKSAYQYMNYIFAIMSDTQAHGNGHYDIRYQILRNPNWTLEEKKYLIFHFYPKDDIYDETLEEWEWGIINDPVNYKGNQFPQLDKVELYNYTYEFLLEFYGNKEIADRIWQEIKFCEQMHSIRPQSWEKSYQEYGKVLAKKPNE